MRPELKLRNPVRFWTSTNSPARRARLDGEDNAPIASPAGTSCTGAASVASLAGNSDAHFRGLAPGSGSRPRLRRIQFDGF